ncbi:hypothetical protein MBLNU230_g6480t1 [Neophaeotheca triangularis]
MFADLNYDVCFELNQLLVPADTLILTTHESQLKITSKFHKSLINNRAASARYQRALQAHLKNGKATDLIVNVANFKFNKLQTLLNLLCRKKFPPFDREKTAWPLTINLIFTSDFEHDPEPLPRWINITKSMARKGHPIITTYKSPFMSGAPAVQEFLYGFDFWNEFFGHHEQIAKALVTHRFPRHDVTRQAASIGPLGPNILQSAPVAMVPCCLSPSQMRRMQEQVALTEWVAKWDGQLEYDARMVNHPDWQDIIDTGVRSGHEGGRNNEGDSEGMDENEDAESTASDAEATEDENPFGSALSTHDRASMTSSGPDYNLRALRNPFANSTNPTMPLSLRPNNSWGTQNFFTSLTAPASRAMHFSIPQDEGDDFDMFR